MSNDRDSVRMTNTSFSERPPWYRRELLAYLGVWLLALVTRAVYLWQIRQAPVFTLLIGDAESYDAWARQIANGDWLGKGVFYQAPLYPYFLGVLYSLFGRNFLAVRLVQIVIGAGSCALLARAGRSFFTRTAGLLAGIFLAVYPTAIFFDCSIQKSVLDLFFMCALLATLGMLLERPQRRWWAVAGAVLALLALTRENALIFLPIVLAWLFAAWPRELWTTRLQWAGPFLLGLTALLLPVGCRNLVVGGEFHLTTAQFGPNFYIGNGKDATGFYHALRWGRGTARFERDDATTLAELATGRKLTPSDVSHYWTSKALNEIRADPSHWLRLMWKKWRLVWNVGEMGDSDDQYTYGDWSSLLRVLNHLLHFGILCPLAAFGVCLTWKQRKRLCVLYAMLLGYAASVALFFVFSRYRFPLVPILILLAAAALACLRDALREARWRTVWAGLAAAAAAAVICNRPMVPEAVIRGTTHYNIADTLMSQQAKPEQALVHYREAIRLMPDFAAAYVGLGRALAQVGKTEEAIGEYLQALRLKPDYADAHCNLGALLAGLGRVPEAVEHLKRALQTNPDMAEAHNNLGNALKQLGQVPEAIGEYSQALRLQPDYADAHNNLGVVLEQAGRAQEAIEHFEQALRIQPDFAEALNNSGHALARLGNVPGAISHYEKALRIKPDMAEAYYNMGSALVRVGRVQEAMRYWEQALRIKPEYAEAHYNLGVALEQVGRLEDAIAHYDQALRLKPEFTEAQNRLARLRAIQ